MKVWHWLNIIWLVLFIIGIVFVLVRKVDGAGAVQTPQVKMVSVMVLLGFYLFIWLCQLITLYFIKKHK
ncbi:DUF3923 family protein [Companilactobacillus zhachilii]|uniref:DUF3923 family protein n=1 Tax=Companilactobacillus zhachilii TaxID=2304606 RepID=A0A386PSC4_9LACO|nr:DUF3923 family protein [Companilactobacillus zhachilii]AYE37785.1 DUF3923 family protein [Companilactobacillus zhachilii]